MDQARASFQQYLQQPHLLCDYTTAHQQFALAGSRVGGDTKALSCARSVFFSLQAAQTIMTRLSMSAAVGAALVATSSAFTLSAVPSSSAAMFTSSSRGYRRSRACAASQRQQQPSMVTSVPRTVPETGTKAGAASKQRLHVQVRSNAAAVVCTECSMSLVSSVVAGRDRQSLGLSCFTGLL